MEFGAELAVNVGVQASTEQLARGQVVAFTKAATDAERLIATAASGCRRHRQQLVGHLRHGAHHHKGAIGDTRFHDAGNAIDGRGVLYRGATELHHDHGNSPCTLRSSAFSNAAPAAPRMVLCESTVNL